MTGAHSISNIFAFIEPLVYSTTSNNNSLADPICLLHSQERSPQPCSVSYASLSRMLKAHLTNKPSLVLPLITKLLPHPVHETLTVASLVLVPLALVPADDAIDAVDDGRARCIGMKGSAVRYERDAGARRSAGGGNRKPHRAPVALPTAIGCVLGDVCLSSVRTSASAKPIGFWV